MHLTHSQFDLILGNWRPKVTVTLSDASSRKRGKCFPATAEFHQIAALHSRKVNFTKIFNCKFDAVCIVLDVGLTSSTSGFLKNGRRVASELIQRKLYNEALDRFGLVLVGTDKAKNSLNYDHVTVLDRDLKPADWELLEYVENQIKGMEIKLFLK